MHWSKRLKQWSEDRGWTAVYIAKHSGVGVETVRKWLQGAVERPGGDDLAAVLKLFGKTEPELFYGIDASQVVQLGDIPLMPLESLGALKRGQNPLDLWDGETKIRVPIDRVSQDAIGLSLNDDAGAPEFGTSDVVTIEPKQEPVPGRFVVAVLEKIRKAVFRRYRPSSLDPDSPYQLLATNPDFPEIEVSQNNPGFIVGLAVLHTRSI